MQRDIKAGLYGAVAGALATIPMSAFMLGAQKSGNLGELPPRLMSSVALGAIGKRDTSKTVDDLVAAELHLDIGVLAGAIFGIVTCRTSIPVHRAVQGTLFGLMVWVAAYKGAMPMLKVMPPPERDRPDRPIAMILSHVVFGASLGWLVNRKGC